MLHGVNHNMFGKRDPAQYGTITLDEIDEKLRTLGGELGVEVVGFQTIPEGAMWRTDSSGLQEAWTASLSMRGMDAPQLRDSGRLGDLTVPVAEIHVEHPRQGGIPASFSLCGGRKGADLRFRPRQLSVGPARGRQRDRRRVANNTSRGRGRGDFAPPPPSYLTRFRSESRATGEQLFRRQERRKP